jgi:hypothetical protein
LKAQKPVANCIKGTGDNARSASAVMEPPQGVSPVIVIGSARMPVGEARASCRRRLSNLFPTGVRIGCSMMGDDGAFGQGPFGTAERRETCALGRTGFDR